MDVYSTGTDSYNPHIFCSRIGQPFPILQLCVRKSAVTGRLLSGFSATDYESNGFLQRRLSVQGMSVRLTLFEVFHRVSLVPIGQAAMRARSEADRDPL